MSCSQATLPFASSPWPFSAWFNSATCALTIAFSFLSGTYAETPKPLVQGWTMERVAAEPELVTPIGCRFDDQGRLFVVECHTHFPPADYSGPKQDRIYIFRDRDGDGRMDEQKLFYEGGKATMGLAIGKEGWIYLVTRSEVARVRDQDGDGTAEQREVLVKLETAADYPHNGLAAIQFGPDGWLYFGQGENFGQPYKLIGTDGSQQTGGGEGGNVFRCTADGGKIERWATGLWNPFGLCFDHTGRFWTVENDPDARPPCRLIQLIRGGDYGFQFRFGRAGTHPLLAWNGELPGTLPMTAGTGEAPCAVMPYRDEIWVTSWGDNRIERFPLKHQGSSWSSKLSTLVQGDVNFRPVDMAIAPDGSVYVTDWVDRSYPVHQKGRLWRLVPEKLTPHAHDALPQDNDQGKQLQELLTATDLKIDAIWAAAASPDPFLAQAAVTRLSELDLNSLTAPDRAPDRQAALLRAHRWRDLCTVGGGDADRRNSHILKALNSDHAEIRRLAVRWSAETNCQPALESLRKNLRRGDLKETEFAEIVSAISYLQTGSASPKARDPQREALLTEILNDTKQPATIRALALRFLPTESATPKDEELVEALRDTSERNWRREVVATLLARKSETAFDSLSKLAINSSIDRDTRADAIAALGAQRDKFKEVLEHIASSNEHPELIEEAKRSLAVGTKHDGTPPVDDVFGWWKLVSTGGDKARGRRVFYRSICMNCHAYRGRGSALGPELSTLSGTTNRRRIMESILQPSREIAPLFATWKILTTDGRVLTGAKLNGGGVGTNLKYLAPDGSTFELPLTQIESQELSPVSIMPADIIHGFSLEELKDLLAFLE